MSDLRSLAAEATLTLSPAGVAGATRFPTLSLRLLSSAWESCTETRSGFLTTPPPDGQHGEEATDYYVQDGMLTLCV